ncbi:hypothetical protein Rhow_008497 [Rhodococcus wratislaviensis]|uniref:Uncharacterized protein n=1 Tax=Rhodococcus wratislaviensis TaxID=44752 RepID=A0A402CKY4_RHOWR|nr:hypothetical protein Rhow_008497 [Rhodococcus wratislaviensis]
MLCGLLSATDIGAPNERALRNDCTSAGLKMQFGVLAFAIGDIPS